MNITNKEFKRVIVIVCYSEFYPHRGLHTWSLVLRRIIILKTNFKTTTTTLFTLESLAFIAFLGVKNVKRLFFFFKVGLALCHESYPHWVRHPFIVSQTKLLRLKKKKKYKILLLHLNICIQWSGQNEEEVLKINKIKK